MKNFLKTCAILFFMIVTVSSSFAHKEWVHQYIVKEAFKLLKAEMPGQSFPDLDEFLGSDDQFGIGDPFVQPFYPEFGDNSIVRGAYQEDVIDLIWDYGKDGNKGFDPSSTHFWNAQSGDGAHTQLPFGEVVQNAFEKAKRYYFGKSEFSDFSITRHGFMIPVLNYPRGLFALNSYTLSYPSLCDVYHNASLTFKDASYGFEVFFLWFDLGCICWNIDLHGASYPLNATERKRFSYNIFGRMLHLLADMSVPAHTHNDLHPCNPGGTVFGVPVMTGLEDGDEYELFMGDNLTNNSFDNVAKCNEPHNNPATAGAWNVNACQQQGGLIWEIFSMTDDDALRYLYYTTNRLAAHFASWSVQNGFQEAGNHFLFNGTTPFINSRYAALGNPSGAEPNGADISDEAFRYSIRATATLLYWIQLKLNQLSCVDVVRLQNDNFIGTAIAPATQLVSIEANQEVIAGRDVFPSSSNRPNGNYTVHDQAQLQFRAGQDIQLEDGFFVNAGADFHALVADPACTITNQGCGGGSDAIAIDNHFTSDKNSKYILSTIDTAVKTVLIYTDSNATINGTINDTIILSRYLAALWDTTGIRGDSITLSGDRILDSLSVYTISVDTVKILYQSNTLRDEIDTSAIIQVYGNGVVHIYTGSGGSSVHSGSQLPMTVYLYPNPTNKISTISYNLPYQAMVSISVLDDLGHEKGMILSNQHQQSGEHTLTYDFSKLPHGIYYVRVQYSGKVKTVQLVSPGK
jgi:hypothetical protein